MVSPHLLVGQAVAAALLAAGAPVEFHEWGTLRRDLRTRPAPTAVRHVVVIVEGEADDEALVVDRVAGLTDPGDVRVVVVTADPPPPEWARVLVDDRIEVVAMTSSIGDLAATIARFVAGRPLMTSEERIVLRAEWEQLVLRRRTNARLVDALSPQQLRVLRLLATGHRVQEVARLLGISDGTVRSHVKTLRQRLGARTQLEAVAMLRQVEDVGAPAPVAATVPRPRVPTAGEEQPVPRR